ncbi:vacuolar alkaline phosphatase [Coemansia asiatica]|nr:vacuolar alkaline phosphatase [Coemansia asiatica]
MQLLGQSGGDSQDTRYRFVRDTVLPDWMGIKDASHEEITSVAEETNSVRLRQLLSTAISDRAQIGWATHGHSAVDVNLYAYGKDAHVLRGNHENTEIGQFIIDSLGLDLDLVTSKIKGERVTQQSAPVQEAWLGRRDVDAPEHYPLIH